MLGKTLGRGLRPVAAGLALTVMPTGSQALEPLSHYLEAGRRTAPEMEEVRAESHASRADTQSALAQFYPDLSGTGGYTRNQFNIVAQIPESGGTVQTATFVPYNQLDATFAAEMPLLDMGAVRSLQAAKANERASSARVDSAAQSLAERICTAYTGVIAYEALTRAATKSIDAARTNLRVVEDRVRAGLASELDSKRASALLDSAHQVRTNAELERRDAARRLEALTGVPVEAPIPELDLDLRPEAPLSSWLTDLDELPQSRLARAEIDAAEATKRASRAAMMPLVSARAQERLTNAAGFAKRAMWAVGVNLTAKFEVSAIHKVRAEEARVEARKARLQRTLRDERLDIESAHDRVGSARVNAETARSEAESAKTALRVADSRYAAGTATQLEVVQALRDDFQAKAHLIQAHAELALARMKLRLAAGRPVVEQP